MGLKGEHMTVETRRKIARAQKPRPAIDRVLEKCEQRGECLVFTGATNPRGYGKIGVGSRVDGSRRSVGAYVVVWEHIHGAVPPGFEVCHACDNPACVRIEHLFLGTHAENVRDMQRKGRGLTKLTLSDVERIRNGGESIRALARELGLSPATVHRHRWKER